MKAIALIVVLLATWGGCSPGVPRVTRYDSHATSVDRVHHDEVTDLSGYWNDTDARKVAQELVHDCLSRGWLANFIRSKGAEPRVVVGVIRNRAPEHIAVEALKLSLERELINSGKVRFVADRSDRDFIRKERYQQSLHATDDTVRNPDGEHAADFVLQGYINANIDRAGGTAIRFYQVNMVLIDIESLEKRWIGQSEIKKLVERGAYGF